MKVCQSPLSVWNTYVCLQEFQLWNNMTESTFLVYCFWISMCRLFVIAILCMPRVSIFMFTIPRIDPGGGINFGRGGCLSSNERHPVRYLLINALG